MRLYISISPRRTRIGIAKRMGLLSLFLPLYTSRRRRKR